MTYAISLLSSLLIAALLGTMLIPNILVISYKKKLFDQPDKRKIHSTPVPRSGGISFFPVILVTLCIVVGLHYSLCGPVDGGSTQNTLCEYLFFTAGCMLLYIIGIADDLVGVGYRRKFLAQTITALLIVLQGNWINSLGGLFGVYDVPAWFGIPFSVITIVYITNAINLIDGIDGLASGLCCIALTALGIMCAIRGDLIYACLAASTLGVLIPFWFFNVFGNAQRGHKLFMGDTGSLTLGYILSFIVIHISKKEVATPCTPNADMVMAFSTLIVPLLDVVRVVMHRLRTGKNPFLPDKNHIHHKLRRTGMRLRIVLVTILCISLSFFALNALLVSRMNITLLLAVDIILWTAMQLTINRFIKRNEHKRNENIAL